MGFVTPALLGGTLLVALPIVLHLIMRREPQRLQFPALRFVQQRRSLNQHRLKLRHLVLLALRCAIIAALALALARPTIRGSGILGKEGAPVAAALVFDNSARMEYVRENETNLQRAQELAQWLVDQLPAESPLAVVDLARGRRTFASDHDTARLQIKRLRATAAASGLDDALAGAIQLLSQKVDYRPELYVFTDMASSAWTDETLAQFQRQWSSLPDANLYVIDVGAPQPRNVSLGDLVLSGETVVRDSPVQLETTLRYTPRADDAQDVLVDLYLDTAKGPRKRDQQVVSLKGDSPASVRFTLLGLEEGVHQGYLRITGDDPLPEDDTRYFTFDVQAPGKLLLVAEQAGDAVFLREALAPSVASGLPQPAFQCQVTEFSRLDQVAWDDFASVILLDPPPLTAKTWQSLVDYVRGGRGVAVFLGRAAEHQEFNAAAPQALLPGKLRWQSRNTTYLHPTSLAHPVFDDLREFAEMVPWTAFPVYKYWEFETLDDDAEIVARFADGRPAIVQQEIGRGDVLVMTTPVSDPAHRDPWNLLPTTSDPWPFLALSNGIARFLTGAGNQHLNYFAGQPASLLLPSTGELASYVLQIPAGEAIRQTLPPGANRLVLSTTEATGNYRVLAGGRQQGFRRGFSVNCRAEMTELDRVAFDKIDDALGNERVQLATTTDQLERRVGLGRVGRELFPFLVCVVAVVLGVEHVLANRFYRRS